MKKFYLLISLWLTLLSSNVFAQKDTSDYQWDTQCAGGSVYIEKKLTRDPETNYLTTVDTVIFDAGIYYVASGGDTNNIIRNILTFYAVPDTGVYNRTLCGSHVRDSTFYQTSFTVNGCDSIVKYTYHYKLQGYKDTSATICQGKRFTLRSHYYTTAGNTVIHVPNGGCDSLLTLHLTVKPTYSGTATNVSVNNCQPYNFYGYNVDHSGLYTKILNTKFGCDSIIRINVTYTSQHREEVSSESNYTEVETSKVYDTKGALIGEGKLEDIYPNMNFNQMYIINSQKKLIKQ